MSHNKKRNKGAKPCKTDDTPAQCDDGDQKDSGESMEERFERELIWCVEQLQLGLETQNPDSRQAMEATKVLKILLSSKAPLIKKRQAMRNTFGDYRKQMREQEKKSAAAAKRMKLLPVNDEGYQKSTFFRKSAKRTMVMPDMSERSKDSKIDLDEVKTLEISNDTPDQPKMGDSGVGTNKAGDKVADNDGGTEELNESFKFGFKLNEEAIAAPDDSREAGSSKSGESDMVSKQQSYEFNKSNNAFRFNFSAVDDQS